MAHEFTPDDPIKEYDPGRIEQHWQAVWQQTRLYETDLQHAQHPFYNLMMFPYPSAEGLHVGNMYAFTGADIYGRFMAMNGYDVFEPMGFDAFGIHSENFAIKQGIHPAVLTARSVERFRETQLKRIGARYDWQHEVQTTDPQYYRWTQWIFLQLFKAGLAVRKRGMVNWCPSCKTVLADEQVIDGACERCDTSVVQRELEQWFFRITSYAQRLLENLDSLDWSEKIKNAQRQWIGRSEGLQFRLEIEGHPGTTIEVFTTRPDTIFGMTYVVLAPEHPLVDTITGSEQKATVEAYGAEVCRKSELERMTQVREKSGVFTGACAINPVNGERIPIWIADYVLITYGTGAIMAVPAHDERDFEFARTFDLPIRQVIVPAGESVSPSREEPETAFTEPGTLINSGAFSGVSSQEASDRISAWFKEHGLGQQTVQYRLRDWLISRQRYWGPPIPVIHCDRCGIVPVPEEDLPVLLPDVDDWMPKGTGSSPLAQVESFVNTTCPTCGEPARRETDVSDNFLDSGWYFLRYPSSNCETFPFEPEMTRKWLPVNMYIGGPEHSVLHLLYSRFISMALHDLGFLDFEEPFTCFRAHGLITKDGAKISKSHGNVINPDEYINQYGADTFRLFLMFLGPLDHGGDFTDQGIGGIKRFLSRVWSLVNTHAESFCQTAPEIAYRRALHKTIQKVTDDIKRLKYNTAIAALMEYLNDLSARPSGHIYAEDINTFLRLLAPFAPHIAEELWQRIGEPYSIHQQAWPRSDPELLIEEYVKVAVQINGRLRATVELPVDAGQEHAVETALQHSAVQRYVEKTQITRVIYVPNRVINLVG